jgi:hypothetical protein
VTKIDWENDKQRHLRQDLGRERNYTDSRQHEAKIRNQEQQQFLQFASAHAHKNQFCADIARQGRVSRAQANVLRRISRELGDPIRPVTNPNAGRQRCTERDQPPIRQQLLRARDAVVNYDGTDGWIIHLCREFALKDPEWLPTEKQAIAIMKKIDGTT